MLQRRMGGESWCSSWAARLGGQCGTAHAWLGSTATDRLHCCNNAALLVHATPSLTYTRCTPARTAAAAGGPAAQRSAHPAAARCHRPLPGKAVALHGAQQVEARTMLVGQSGSRVLTRRSTAREAAAAQEPRTDAALHASRARHCCLRGAATSSTAHPTEQGNPDSLLTSQVDVGLRARHRKRAAGVLVRDAPRLLPQRHRADVQLLRQRKATSDLQAVRSVAVEQPPCTVPIVCFTFNLGLPGSRRWCR